MCGRYVHPDEAAMERFWKIDRRNSVEFLLPSFNVAPTARVPIIVRGQSGALELHDARWGLIPSWWKKPAAPTLTFNARSEEAFEKPMWRASLHAQRCLMPAHGWYEWNEHEPLTQARTSANQPYYLYCPDMDVIAFAGLWSLWEGPDGASILSCALLSRDAAPAIANIHHRMPAVVQPDLYDEWLDPANGTDTALAIIRKARTDLKGHRVSPRVNNTRNDSRELTEEVGQAPQGSLF
jgi:putative SOS response-associated peptidase YedK